MRDHFTFGLTILASAFLVEPVFADYLPNEIAPKCRYGDEIPGSSPKAQQAQKNAWDFVAGQLTWSKEKRPRAVVCDVRDWLIVDYRFYNKGVLVEYVILDAKNASVVLMRLSEY